MTSVLDFLHTDGWAYFLNGFVVTGMGFASGIQGVFDLGLNIDLKLSIVSGHCVGVVK